VKITKKITKIGKYLLGPPEEMWVMKSPNLLSARDAADITWELLPQGGVGIQPVGGHETTNLEEAHVLPLTGAGYPGLYVAGRTTVGWIVESHTAVRRPPGGLCLGLRAHTKRSRPPTHTHRSSWRSCNRTQRGEPAGHLRHTRSTSIR
jgi:hypothetical protein